ncbi:hypothetical protein GCM10010383_07790 [Streptomyces lomondensis]|uniref:Uncharacterized protein n=1 Tax=Streptomyces lomondensis TaxID=68229 RepID=A0ABQ2WYV0_9ACTN|nr:hypothetical protein GCM10010383_07790 [Streptomyces lomondensis]
MRAPVPAPVPVPEPVVPVVPVVRLVRAMTISPWADDGRSRALYDRMDPGPAGGSGPLPDQGWG